MGDVEPHAAERPEYERHIEGGPVKGNKALVPAELFIEILCRKVFSPHKAFVVIPVIKAHNRHVASAVRLQSVCFYIQAYRVFLKKIKKAPVLPAPYPAGKVLGVSGIQFCLVMEKTLVKKLLSLPAEPEQLVSPCKILPGQDALFPEPRFEFFSNAVKDAEGIFNHYILRGYPGSVYDKSAMVAIRP